MRPEQSRRRYLRSPNGRLLKGSSRQEIKNLYVKHEDPVIGFERCPFYFEAVHNLLVTHDTEPALRATDAKISGLTQQPMQRAVEFYSAILKNARRYGAACPLDDVVDISLRGVDDQLVSVHSEWLKLSHEASDKATSESNRIVRRREAFRNLLTDTDGHRQWKAKTPK